MRLENRKHFEDQYRCELTKELDMLAKLSERHSYKLFSHYILADNCSKKERCFAIRVPGGTVGGIWIDDNNVITKIVINTNYVVTTYPDDVNELMEKYIGEVIEW